MRHNAVLVRNFALILRFLLRRKKLSVFLLLAVYAQAETNFARFIPSTSVEVKGLLNKTLNMAVSNNYALGVLFCICAYAIFVIYRKISAYRYIKSEGYSSNINDYKVNQADFERENSFDKEARKLFFLKVAEIQGNKCICGKSHNGYDFDHLMIPKSKGGNFILKHKTGALISNMIILCQTCNRSKGAKDWRKFFNPSQIMRIVNYQKEMTEYINNSFRL